MTTNEKKPVKVIVTGDNGFIGKSLTAGLDRAGLSWAGASRSNGHDLCRPDGMDGLPAADWIVHLAARTSIMESWDDPDGYHRTNTLTTLAALEYARRHGSSMLYLSSYMYGVPQYLPIDEKHPVSARNPYAWSKLASELLCEAYAADFDVPVVILRPFNVYGSDQSAHQLIPHILEQAKAGDTISLADMEPKRDWLWIDDLVEAITRVITDDRKVKGCAIYNVGFGQSCSVQEVLDVVLAQAGPRTLICREETRRNEILDCVCDFGLFQQDYGWSPVTPLKEGIRLMIQAHWQDIKTPPSDQKGKST